MSFVAGAHVFPGGRVDDSDLLADAAACCDGLETPPRVPHLDGRAELARRVAAARELVEEAGVLVARRRGRWAAAGEVAELRRRLRDGVPFEQVVREGGWRLALDALVPFAHVVTPASEPRRFDTLFFLTELPAGQEPRSDAVESDELTWLAPARAMDEAMGGGVVLLPPTWVMLMQLAPFDSIDALLAWARATRIVRVEPALTVTSDARLISFPGAGGDLRFSFADGRGWRPVASFPSIDDRPAM